MCFSASASFTASALLFTIWCAIRQKNPSKSELMFTSIPLLFAVQQMCEGFLWISLAYTLLSTYLTIAVQMLSMYGFLFFAYGVWPAWIPIAAWMMEKDSSKRLIFYILMALGLFTSTALILALTQFPVTAMVSRNHIQYMVEIPMMFQATGMVAYLISVIIPFLLSERVAVKIFGAAIAAAYALTCLFYFTTLTSVWCFFSAILSAGIWFIVKNKQHNAH
jgi:hypothetical protein